MGKWVEYAPGRCIRINEDGTANLRMRGSVRRTVENNAELQKAGKRDPSLTETTGGNMRMIASFPEDVHQEMIEKCGHDPENQKKWLRDNPQWLVVQPKDAHLPPRRKVILPRRSGK